MAIMETNKIIRPADFSDAEEIFALIKSYPDELIPRAMGDIVQCIDRFIVCSDCDRIIGTASWKILPEVGAPNDATIEIQSVAVDKRYKGKGIGKKLIDAVLTRISPMHPAQIIVLTFTPEFFRKIGFHEISKTQIMHKIYTGCINCTKYDNPFTCPEVAMAMNIRAATDARN